MQRRKLEELNLLDDFLFHAMLAYPDTGEAFIRKLLETLFDRKFPHLKIRAQESFAGSNTDLRGARLDVYIEEDGSVQINGDEIPTIYDVEPDHNHKTAEIKAFPKRARFYHAMIDRRSLKAGEHFGDITRDPAKAVQTDGAAGEPSHGGDCFITAAPFSILNPLD